MTRRPILTLALMLGAVLLAIAVVSGTGRAQTFTTTIDQATGRIVVSLPRCTTACPDSTAVVGTIGLTAFARHVLLPGQRVDTLVIPRGAAVAAVRVVVTAMKGKVYTTTIAALPPPPTPVPVPVPVPVPTPTPAPSAFTPNLPPGLSLIVDTRFGDAQMRENTQPVGTSGLSYTNWCPPKQPCAFASGHNTTDASAPFGPDVFEQRYPGNHLGNGTGGAGILGPEGQKWTTVYFAMSVWVSPNYSMHSNGEKFLYLMTTAATDAAQQATLLEWVLRDTETPNGATFGLEFNPNYNLGIKYAQPTGEPWYWIFQANGTPRLRKGVWQTVEVLLEMNTPGQANGAYRAWIDNQLVLSGSNATFRGGSRQGYFNGIKFDGTRGGGASNTPTPPDGQSRRYNRLAWYAKN